MNGTTALGTTSAKDLVEKLKAHMAGNGTLPAAGQQPEAPPASQASPASPVVVAMPAGAGPSLESSGSNAALQQQVLLIQAMEKERKAIERERQAIQREREAIDNERKRQASGSPYQRGRLEDAERSDSPDIAKERRLLAQEREAVEQMKEGHKRERAELMREKEGLSLKQREQERYRQQMDEDRVKIEREVQMMANLAAAETRVLKEALERMKQERTEMEREREQLRNELQQLTATQEQLIAERDELASENERLEKSRDALLGIQRDSGAEGLQAERRRIEAERMEQEQAEIQLARDTVERDKQEIEKIRVEIENIMKAWEAERDRQARERLQLDAEREELVSLRTDTERQWRQMVTLPAAMPLLSGILGQQQATGVPVLPSFAAMTMNANGQSLAPAAAGLHTDDRQNQQQQYTPQQPRGSSSSSLSTSPVSTPPQLSSQPHSTGSKRKRKRGDSLTNASVPAQDSGDADFKKRRKVRPWEERYEELLQFKDEHGHFSVPASGDYASLRIWVNNQKALHTKGQLAADRFEKLNGIGFPWWNPKGNRSGKGKKNEDGGDDMVEVKTEESQTLAQQQAHDEDKAQRQRELEEFFGSSLEAYPALVHKFAVKNSERAIDNAFVWLSVSSQHIGDAKLEKSPEGCASAVPPSTEQQEETAAAKERRDKVALLRRVEGIVGLGDDPLRELMETGGFRVFSSDVNLRREDLDWLTLHYDEIKSAFLLSTFSKKVNKGDWNQKLLMNELEKIYSSFLGFDLQHRNLRTKFLSTLGKAVSEWSYFLPREQFTVWSHAVCLRAKHLSQQPSGAGACGLSDAQFLQFDRDRFVIDRKSAGGDVGTEEARELSPLVRLLNLPYLVDATNQGTPSSVEPTRRTSVDVDPAQSTSSRASSPPSLSSSSSSSSLNNSTEEGVSSLLNSFNLPNFPSYVHKKPFQRRRGSSNVPGASLAALAYQHMQQQHQQPSHVSEVIIEEVSSSDDDENENKNEMTDPSTSTSTSTTTATATISSSASASERGQQATIEEIEDDAPSEASRPTKRGIDLNDIDRDDDDGESANREASPSSSSSSSAGHSGGELMIDLNDDDDDNNDNDDMVSDQPTSTLRS